ncbi:MAG: tetratricopeptide repeat-containing sensor histidine kinase, partial [Bacteroidales bacterium]
KANQNLGECHSQIGDYEKALDFFIKSLNIKMQLNDSKGIATTYSSIGHIHFLLDQFDQALEYYRKSLQTNIEIGYEMGIAAGYGNVGSILFEQNRQDSALYYFEKSAEIYKKNEAINYLANVNLNIGKVHFARKDFINAGKYYHDAEEIKIQLDDKLGIYNTWALFSSLYLEKARSTKTNTVLKNNELKSALDYGKKAYDLSLITKNMPGQHESAGYLKDIYSELGNLAEALKFAQLEMQISDSLSLIQRTDALVNAEIRWKAERKQIEIDRLEKEKSLQEVVILQKSSLANRLIIITLFVLLVLILIIIGSMLFIKNKAKQKAIEYQNHIIEVTRLKMQNINNRLSPHLFFNILSSVSSEAGDAEKVKEKINQAAVLLRTSLENAESNSITLARELEMVKAYVDIQKSRLHETFESSFLISESVDLEMPIPVMILLIPIENSIKHGLMSLDGEKKLIVTIENSNQTVIIKVIDNGIGRKNSKGRTTGTGTGLKVLLQTIRLLNDGNVDKILFNIHDTEPQGTEVEIIIPKIFDYCL